MVGWLHDRNITTEEYGEAKVLISQSQEAVHRTLERKDQEPDT